MKNSEELSTQIPVNKIDHTRKTKGMKQWQTIEYSNSTKLSRTFTSLK